MTPTRSGKKWHPTPTHSTWLAVGDLTLVQFRPVSKTKVNKIVKEFDPDAVGVIYVSQRADDTKIVLDGAHRVTSVDRLWGKAERVPCLVYEGLSPEDEYKLFVEFNDARTRPRPIDLFLARTEYDHDAQEILKIVTECGFKVADGQGQGRLQSVQAVETVYDRAGPDVLRRTFRILTGAWGMHSSSVQGPLIMAVGSIVSRYPKLVNDQRLSKTLEMQSAAVWTQEARVLKAKIAAFADSRVHGTLAQMIVQVYSKRLSEQKRLVWEERNSRNWWGEKK